MSYAIMYNAKCIYTYIYIYIYIHTCAGDDARNCIVL